MPVELQSALCRSVRTARAVAVLTGAGISAESGVPTFRQAQTGNWSRFKPEELATPEAFRRQPKLVWEWYAWRRRLVAAARPNAGHLALATWERRVPQFTLITQNVDGLHARAGSRNVIELHGDIGRTRCFSENVVIDTWPDTGDVPPRCPRCGGLLRPDVVWFNEPLPAEAMDRALAASRSCALFLAVGTSAVVHPAASLPLEALASGAVLVEVNPEPTPLSGRAHHVLRGPAGEILPRLVEVLD